MNTNQSDNLDQNVRNIFSADPAQQHKGHEGEKNLEVDEGTILKEEAEKGMDMGTTFKEDSEQDLDDLIHSQGTLKKDEFPRPDEV